MSGGGKGGSNQTVAYYYVPIAFVICEGPIIGIKRIWAGGNLIFSDSQPVAVNTYQGGGKKSGPTVSTSYQQFSSSTQNDIQTGGSSLGPWTCYLGTETQPADPTIGEGVAYRGNAYIVFNPLNIGPGATVPPLTFEVVTQGSLNAPVSVWSVQTNANGSGIGFDGSGNPVVPQTTQQIPGTTDASTGYQVFASANGNRLRWPIQGSMNFASWVGLGSYRTQCSIAQPGGLGADLITVVTGPSWGTGSCALYDCCAGLWIYGGSNTYFGTLDPDGFSPTQGAQCLSLASGIVTDGNYMAATISAGAYGPTNLQAFPVPGTFQPGINPYLEYVGGWPSPYTMSGPACMINGVLYAQSIGGGVYYAPTNANVTLCNDCGQITGPTVYGAGPGIAKLQVGNFGNESSYDAELVSNLPSTFCLSEGGDTFCIYFVQGGENYLGYMDLDGNLISSESIGSQTLQQIYCAYGAIFGVNGTTFYKYSQTGQLIASFDTPNYSAGGTLANCGDGYIYGLSGGWLTKIDSGGRVITAGPMTLPAAVTILCERAGLTQFDVSQLPATPVNFVRGDTVTARSMLQRLSQAYFFSMVDSGGILKFIPQGQPSQAVIPLEDLGYGKVTANAQTPFTSTRISGVDLPRSVKIRYYSAALNYDHYEQIFALESYDSGKEITLDLPLILDDTTAYNIAALACTLPHVEREQYAFTTSYKWLALEPADVVTLPFGVCRILTVKMGQKNGIPVIDFTACVDGMNALAGAGYARPALPNYQPNTGGITALLAAPSNLSAVQTPGSSSPHPIATAPTVEQAVPNAGVPKMVLVEPPPLKSTDTGMRFYAGAYSTGNVFPGAGIFESSDGGDTYTQMVTEISATSAGYANTVLGPPNATQGFYTWDTQNTVDIYMLGNGADPAPMTDLQVMNGANGVMLGQELIQFAQATLMTDSFGNAFYRLSRLLRGRRGTQWAMGTHNIGESFYPIPAALTKESYTPPMLNNAYLYKIVMAGGDLSNAPAVSYEPNGNSLLQWSVCHPLTSVDSSGDWTVSWTPRARYNGDWASGYIPTLDPDTAGWSIDVLSGTTVKRTINVPLQTAAPWQTIYTAAMQSADGFTPGQSGITFNIYSLSSQIGRGTVRSITTP